MRFALIDGAKAEFPVHRLCRVLGVSQSGYFAWRGGQPVAANVTTWCCWRMSDRPLPCRNGTYGSPG